MLDLQVFDFDNWSKHRSTNLYGRHIFTTLEVRCVAAPLSHIYLPPAVICPSTCTTTTSALQSRIVRGLLQPLLTTTGLAVAVAIYQTLWEVQSLLTDLAQANGSTMHTIIYKALLSIYADTHETNVHKCGTCSNAGGSPLQVQPVCHLPFFLQIFLQI